MGQSASTASRQDERPRPARRRNRRSLLLPHSLGILASSSASSSSSPSPSTASPAAAEAQPAVPRTRTARQRPLSTVSLANRLLSPQADDGSPVRLSRLNRARRSVGHNFPSIFSRLPNLHAAPTDSTDEAHDAPDPASHAPTLPQFNFSEENLSEYHVSPAVGANTPATPTQTRPVSPASSHASLQHTPIGSIADRIQSLTPDRGFRSLVRRRRSPIRGNEDQHATLSRMLSVAAAATAASLVGSNSEETVQAARHTVASIEGDDGNFEHFLQSLRSGRLNSMMSADSSTNSLQFFRVFQFGSHSRRPNNQFMRTSNDDDGRLSPHSSEAGADEDNTEGRMVPVLMIGIRSLVGEDGAGSDNNDLAIPGLFESFTGGAEVDLDRQSTRESLMRSGRNGVNFSQRRRASMGGMGLFSHAGREGSRRLNRASDTSRPRSELVESSGDLSTPPGPHPPPTTPSSPPISSVPSGASTPNRGAAVSSTARRTSSINAEREFHHRATHTALEATEEEEEAIGTPRPVRARRLSESDFMRYGSGSSRRNGVVEPDHAPGRENSRSWIIYVLGGSYPENHPILTTPSLFTDSPTYEDMILLQSMLGPAKPPVASKEDVMAAGGLYSTRLGEGSQLQLVGGDPLEYIQLEPEQKCPVCLCEFEAREIARRLRKCQHVFHQTCIDEWLMTGRNACPLCRGEGVSESSVTAIDNGESSSISAGRRVADV